MLLFSFAYQLYFCFPLPLQNGGECLRAYVSVSLEQIAQWRDEQGNNGLWYVMQVVNQLLDPRTSEFTAAFVGRLVSTLISRAGTELGEQLDQILRAILSKMQQAETLSVMQVKPMFCSFISIWMIQLTDTDLTPLRSSPLSLVSDHGVCPPGSLPAGASSGVLVQSSRANRETCPGVCHDGVDEQTAPILRPVRGQSQVRWLIYFWSVKCVGFLLVFNPYHALCPAARWPSVSCCSIASTQMTNVSRILLWREKRYTALTMASEPVLNLSRVSHQNAFRWTCIFYKLPIIPQWRQGWPTVSC